MSTSGVPARRAAIDALVRIDEQGAYANLLLPSIFERRQLSERDRNFVTELVYGTTRMRRACDHLVDQFLLGDADPQVRAALRVGAYQLFFLGTPRHAAVGATVGAVKGRGRGLVNAVLRKVADQLDAAGSNERSWPTDAVRLSYPDWIVDTLRTDLGADQAMAALETMNRAATTHERDDGYIQDPASQAVAAAVDAKAGEIVLDLCAAPGGKATALAATGATVVAGDLQPHRVRLIAKNAQALENAEVLRSGSGSSHALSVIAADALHPPFRPGIADAVLVDAPCSGLGSLRRRADARWRIDADAPARLADLQVALIEAAMPLLKPGGRLIYSACTLTAAETTGVRDRVAERVAANKLGAPAEVGDLELRLPDDEGDGMAHFVVRTTPR